MARRPNRLPVRVVAVSILSRKLSNISLDRLAIAVYDPYFEGLLDRNFRNTRCYGWFSLVLLLIGISVSSLLLTACSSSDPSKTGVGGKSAVQAVLQEKVLLLPPVQGTVGGWCMGTQPGECAPARAFRGPIVAQGGSSQGPSQSSPSVQWAILLTSPEVAVSHPAFDGDFDARFSLAEGEVTEHAKSEEVFTGAAGPRGASGVRVRAPNRACREGSRHRGRDTPQTRPSDRS